ncbi:suppressor of fused domain protein [Nocardia testacea]|uniref:suppressor of fused domain protein n=1 Tax=Nocardia testacea TaxID=248551 RepID=UPI003C2E89D8
MVSAGSHHPCGLPICCSISGDMYSNPENGSRPGARWGISVGLDRGRPESEIRGLPFVEDPELHGGEAPHGRLQFLPVVGITSEEFAAAKGGHARALLSRIEPYLPLWVTDTRAAHCSTEPGAAGISRRQVSANSPGRLEMPACDGVRWSRMKIWPRRRNRTQRSAAPILGRGYRGSCDRRVRTTARVYLSGETICQRIRWVVDDSSRPEGDES